MATDTISALLKELGLTGYEASAYRTLLGRAVFTPGELSLQAEIPRQRIDDVIASLREKGLCQFLSAAPRTVAALAPDLALSALAERRDEALVQERAQVLAATATLRGHLQPLYRQGQEIAGPPHYMETYRRPVQIVSRTEKLIATGTGEMKAFLTGPPVFSREDTLRLFQGPLTQGARLRVLVDSSARPEVELGGLMRDYLGRGLEVRRPEGRSLPLRLLLVEGGGVLIYLRDPPAGPGSYSATLSYHPGMTVAMSLLFEGLWQEPRARRLDRQGHSVG
jgi:sugar-specific transcriptional regulator TrmB